MTDTTDNAQPVRKVRLLHDPAEPDHATVEMLEGALELARTGELRDFALVGFLVGGDVYRAATFKDGVQFIGSLELMKKSILSGMDRED